MEKLVDLSYKLNVLSKQLDYNEKALSSVKKHETGSFLVKLNIDGNLFYDISLTNMSIITNVTNNIRVLRHEINNIIDEIIDYTDEKELNNNE